MPMNESFVLQQRKRKSKWLCPFVKMAEKHAGVPILFNPIALRMTKTLWSFGLLSVIGLSKDPKYLDRTGFTNSVDPRISLIRL